MTDDLGGSKPYCGRCRTIYTLDHQDCPSCGSTLILWKKRQEPEEQAFRWWAVVNFSRVYDAWRRWHHHG